MKTESDYNWIVGIAVVTIIVLGFFLSNLLRDTKIRINNIGYDVNSIEDEVSDINYRISNLEDMLNSIESDISDMGDNTGINWNDYKKK